MQNQDMSLVLSTDAKPRLKWTPELHGRFIEAITQLGGADKATPKTLMRAMGIPGLTLYHLKSHLQKYRLGKNQRSESCSDNNKQEEFEETRRREGHFSIEISDGTHNQINESLQIAQALQMQMEVQRKLHEQIEVQRHLQLRIETQGKYLQLVLKKAQETLSGYNSTAAGMELAKTELSQLVSMVDFGRASSPISEITRATGPTPKDTENKSTRGCGTNGGSMESSLTSSESSLPFTEIKLGNHDDPVWNSKGRKRSGSTISDGNCGELLLPSKRVPTHKERNANQLREFGVLGMLDLNCQYQNGMDSTGPVGIDLNCKGIEEFSGHI